MKTKLLLLLLFILGLTISCMQSMNDRLIVQINEEGLFQVFCPESGKVVIDNIQSAFTLGDNEYLFTLNPKKVKRHFISDKMGKGIQTTFYAKNEEQKIQLVWKFRTFKNKPAVAAKLELINLSRNPIRVDEMRPFSASGITAPSKDPMYYISLEHPLTWGWLKDMEALQDTGKSAMITAYADPTDKGAVIGALSFDRFRASIEIVDQRNASNSIQLKTCHEIEPHLMVNPDETLSSEWIYINPIDDVFTGLEEWATLAGSMNNAVIADPPATGFYTWYYYREHVSEKIMLDNARFLAANKDKFPVNWVHIDWGWQRRFSTGDTVANEKFPHGLKWLAGEIKSLGFHPSLWINPFMYTKPTAEAVDAHPDIFLRDTSGNLVNREPIRNIMGRDFGLGEHMVLEGVTNIVDVSNPKSYAFLEERYDWVNSLGYDMAMMDFIQEARLRPDSREQFKYANLSAIEGTRKALAAARKGLGPEADILGCGTVYEASVGFSNLTRVSTDAPAIWSCVKTACKDLIMHYFMNNKLWTNYADGLFIRDKISPYWRETWWDENGDLVPMRLNDDEAEFYTAVNGLSQAAVLYTEDIQRLKPHRQWLLSLVLPIYEKGYFRPVDMFRTEFANTLQLQCEEGQRKWTVAAGLNWTDDKDHQGLDLGLLDLCPETKYHAFDVFNKVYLGVVGSSETLGPINAHGVLLANLVPDLKRPQIIGTDTHISQGGIEIKDEVWNESKKELFLSLNDLYGRKGNLYLSVPKGYKVSSDIKYKSETFKDGNIVKVPVVLDGDQEIKFMFNKILLMQV